MINYITLTLISKVDCGISPDSKLIICCNLQRISKYTEIKLMLRTIIGSNTKLILQNFGLTIQGSII